MNRCICQAPNLCKHRLTFQSKCNNNDGSFAFIHRHRRMGERALRDRHTSSQYDTQLLMLLRRVAAGTGVFDFYKSNRSRQRWTRASLDACLCMGDDTGAGGLDSYPCLLFPEWKRQGPDVRLRLYVGGKHSSKDCLCIWSMFNGWTEHASDEQLPVT